MDGDIKTKLMEFDLYWRLKRGLQLLDSSFYVGLGIQNMSYESENIQTFAPFAGWMGPSFKKLKYFTWQEFYLKQSLPGKNSNFELKSRTELKWKLYHPLDDQSKLQYSLGYYTEEAVEKKSGALAEAAWVWIL